MVRGSRGRLVANGKDISLGKVRAGRAAQEGDVREEVLEVCMKLRTHK